MTAVAGYTSNYSFNLINFDFPRWHTYEWANWRILDATLRSLGAVANQGIWDNSTSYVAGDRIVDPDNGQIYVCLIDHTSSASGTFADDRTLHPTYWQDSSTLPSSTGEWATATQYNVNDIVVHGTYAWYYCIVSHTSGTFATDLAADKWVEILDITEFRNFYYGPSATAPTTRYDGSALVAGDMYYNSVSNAMLVWSGSSWAAFNNVDGDASTTAFTPTGSIASSNVQDAIAELDGDLVALAAVVAGKAAASHTHAISDVTGLQAALDGKLAAFATGTKMLFVQTAAPTGWTKVTTDDNAALRIVSGTAGSGGSMDFTTAFTSRTPTGTVSTPAGTVTNVAGSVTLSGVTIGNTTLSTTQIPAHAHDLTGLYPYSPGSPGVSVGSGTDGSNTPYSSANTGGGGSHTHSFSGSGSMSGGTGTFTGSAATFTGTAMNFAVKYVDAIVASKD